MAKLALAASIFIALVAGTPALAYAETARPERPMATTSAKPTLAARQVENVTKLKAKAVKEIDRRLESLNKVLTQLNNSAKLSTTDKATLTTAVQSEITGLTTLRAKIEADTDIATLRTDVQSIVKDYRVYAFLMPQVSIMVVADTIISNADKLNETLTNKILPRIQEAQGKGVDVTAANTALTDIQAKLADAKLQAQKAQTTVVSLTPAGYPANKTSLTAARAALMVARKDLVAVHNDVATITATLKNSTAK